MAEYTKINSGLGSDLERYSWTQTLYDVSVNIKVPPETTKKNIICEMTQEHIFLKIDFEEKPIFDGIFPANVEVDESFWCIDEENGVKYIKLFLAKWRHSSWWNCVTIDEPCIDLSKLEPPPSKLYEIDENLQGDVSKYLFDAQQKAMGLPTSDEIKKRELLSDFMKNHPELDFSEAEFY